MVRRLLKRAGADATLVSFLANLSYLLLLTFVVIAALDELGVSTTSFAAVVAAGGLAIGLALQNSLGNFASGFLIIVLQPFKSGDFIEAAGISGTAEAIKVFATVLRTSDNKTIIVPNSAILAGNVINYSARERRRIDLVFAIGYQDDLRRAKDLLTEIVTSDSRVLAEPEPLIKVLELADSSINFAVRPWVATSDYWDTRCDLLEKVKLEFDAHCISIPFPQQDVHVHQVTAA